MAKNMKNIDLIVLHEECEKIRSRKLLNATEIFPILLVISVLYTAINTIGSVLMKNVLSTTLLAFASYIVLLLLSSLLVLRYKHKQNNKNAFSLNNMEISAIFLFILLLNVIYLITLNTIKQDEYITIMIIANLTLYVGFAVSLNDIFNIQSIRDLFKCFIAPFCDVGITFKDWWKILIAVALTALYP